MFVLLVNIRATYFFGVPENLKKSSKANVIGGEPFVFAEAAVSLDAPAVINSNWCRPPLMAQSAINTSF